MTGTIPGSYTEHISAAVGSFNILCQPTT